MPGIGIGLGLGLGGSGGALTEAAVARALVAGGLSDAQARAAIGGAASLPAGLRAVGLMPAARPATAAPAVTPLPAGIAAMWDAGSLAGLADGAAVTTWTDGVGGSVATQTGDSGAPHRFVADSGGGLPAVRLSGAAVLATAGVNAASTAMTGGERGIIVVARNFQGAGAGQANPCLVASGTDVGLLLQATATQSGRFNAMYDCGDAGMRTIGYGDSAARSYGLDGINGTAILTAPNAAGGQITIGGWQDAAAASCGRADVLAIIVFDRAVTAADFKQVHRRYCALLGQARPGGATARTVTFVGDSLTAGYPLAQAGSYPFQMAAALRLPWGTWDQMGVPGYTWLLMRDRTLPAIGDVSAATGNRSIVCVWEWANMRTSAAADVAAAARAVIDALHAQDADRDVVFGTSTDDGSATGVATRGHRADYNAYWDDAANRSGIAAYVPLHLDPDIGVVGAAPTDGTANAFYQPDGLHMQAAGYALVDGGPHGFRAAVQVRLAA